MRPVSAVESLDRFFLEARSKLLDLAGILDRIDRGGKLPADPRLAKIRQGLNVLAGQAGNRAEQVQQIFSLDYDPNWQRPV